MSISLSSSLPKTLRKNANNSSNGALKIRNSIFVRECEVSHFLHYIDLVGLGETCVWVDYPGYHNQAFCENTDFVRSDCDTHGMSGHLVSLHKRLHRSSRKNYHSCSFRPGGTFDSQLDFFRILRYWVRPQIYKARRARYATISFLQQKKSEARFCDLLVLARKQFSPNDGLKNTN